MSEGITEKSNESEGMKRRLANLRLWQPGESGNPAGRRKLSEEEKDARKAARYEVARFQAYKEMPKERLWEVLNSDGLSLVDELMIRRLLKDLENLSTDELHRMYGRQLGAPKQDNDSPSGLTLDNGKVIITIATGKPPDDDGSRTAD